MSLLKFGLRFFRPFRLIVLLITVTSLCGCLSVPFDTLRKSRFINMDAEIVAVEYGEEKRTETLPNGLVCTFDGKVRLLLPDKKRITLYQALTTSGVRYVSKDKQYEFIEKGPYCILRHQGATIFEGVFCRK